MTKRRPGWEGKLEAIWQHRQQMKDRFGDDDDEDLLFILQGRRDNLLLKLEAIQLQLRQVDAAIAAYCAPEKILEGSQRSQDEPDGPNPHQ